MSNYKETTMTTTEKQTHTPGPWTQSKPLNMSVIGHGNSLRIDAEGSAIVEMIAYGKSDQETIANARLIAAAPDLLTAARRASLDIHTHTQFQDTRTSLDAAIAKAQAD